MNPLRIFSGYSCIHRKLTTVNQFYRRKKHRASGGHHWLQLEEDNVETLKRPVSTTVALFLVAPLLAWAQVINLSTGLNYTTIQAAIDATQTLAGHTISVSKGTFTGNITVTKGLTIIGAGIDSTLLRTSQSTVPVVTITANNVTLKKLTVRDATSSGTAGIRLQSVSNVTIDSCSVTNNFRGVQLTSSSDNTISNSRIVSNIENGIVLISSSNRNRITANTVANTVGGIGDWTGNGINTGDQSSSATLIQDNSIHGNAHSALSVMPAQTICKYGETPFTGTQTGSCLDGQTGVQSRTTQSEIIPV
ncbi:MAG: hypothetical protein FJ215_12635 [Ignavibacteria bacterium]|nr:hypothetical protein [Ignavibacteria bacterium]